MSIHYLGTKTASGKNVGVRIGWDRPLSRYFMCIEDFDFKYDDIDPEDPDVDFEEGGYLYSNLSDEKVASNRELSQTVTYFKQKAIDLGINIPEIIWLTVMNDKLRDAGGDEITWKPDGTKEK